MHLSSQGRVFFPFSLPFVLCIAPVLRVGDHR
jgi:hypothetical protein